MVAKKVEPGGPPWKAKHDGIPQNWKHIGEGGNAHVWADKRLAIKRLKASVSLESRKRFEREAWIFDELSRETDLSVVPVLEVRERADQLEIVTELLDGNLAQEIGAFRGEVEKSVKALLPIVKTLHVLANREQRIHHRDIKPENLLYKKQAGEIKLLLSDFGCAYLAGGERLTPDRRAIGAWAYRPPEYSAGKADLVNEKGDVFSLGKVLWAMVNGQRHVVFPWGLWFLDEFDLAAKFQDKPLMHHVMLLIGQACDINPEKRPTLDRFASNLRQLIELENNLNDAELSSRMLKKEAEREIAHKQRKHFASRFVRTIYSDFTSAVDELHRRSPSLKLFQEWANEMESSRQSEDVLIYQFAEKESDAHIINVFFLDTLLSTRFYPAGRIQSIRFSLSLGERAEGGSYSQLTIYGKTDGLTAEMTYADGATSEEEYGNRTIFNFLLDAAILLP